MFEMYYIFILLWFFFFDFACLLLLVNIYNLLEYNDEKYEILNYLTIIDLLNVQTSKGKLLRETTERFLRSYKMLRWN
jgi:hypothetical protein